METGEKWGKGKKGSPREGSGRGGDGKGRSGKFHPIGTHFVWRGPSRGRSATPKLFVRITTL